MKRMQRYNACIMVGIFIALTILGLFALVTWVFAQCFTGSAESMAAMLKRQKDGDEAQGLMDDIGKFQAEYYPNGISRKK